MLTEAKRFGTAGRPLSTPKTWKKVCRVGWWAGVCGERRGVAVQPLLTHTPLLTLYPHPHFPKGLEEKLYVCLQQGRGQVGRSSKAFLKAGKHTYCCPYGTQREWTQCTQETREGVYVTVRQCAPVLQRMQGPEESGLNPWGQRTKGDWHQV